MDALVASAIAVLVGCGVYLVLRARTFPVVLGVMLLGYGVNLFLLAMGRVGTGRAPIIADGTTPYVDPIPQALVLTAIVIGFGMAALLVVLAMRTSLATGSDHVDGVEPAVSETAHAD